MAPKYIFSIFFKFSTKLKKNILTEKYPDPTSVGKTEKSGLFVDIIFENCASKVKLVLKVKTFLISRSKSFSPSSIPKQIVESPQFLSAPQHPTDFN